MIKKGRGFFATYATVFTVISAIFDLLGVFVCKLMISKFSIRVTYFFSFIFTLIVLMAFAISGYCNFFQMYGVLVILIRFSQSCGVGAISWTYLPDILPLVGVT